jgi:hypothetical protein
MIRVKATREGLVGQKTATGWAIDKETPFVALPSGKALHKWVEIKNPANGKTCRAQVLDVGPWNEHDDAYVFDGGQHLSTASTSSTCMASRSSASSPRR